MPRTTIALSTETRDALAAFRQPDESYEEMLRRELDIDEETERLGALIRLTESPDALQEAAESLSGNHA